MTQDPSYSALPDQVQQHADEAATSPKRMHTPETANRQSIPWANEVLAWAGLELDADWQAIRGKPNGDAQPGHG